MRRHRRRLLLSVLIAAVIGFAAGWIARIWSAQSVEDRMRDAAHQLQERARETAH